MRKILFYPAVILSLLGTSMFFSTETSAQRLMEKLNRGTVAVRTSTSAVLVSWRILGPEYSSNATYNLYRSSTLIASGLTTSNYVDNVSTDYSYSVAAVVNGTEQALSAGVTPWSTFYKLIPISQPSGGTTPDGVAYTYEANDASVGDLDGDGDLEIVLKWEPTNSKDNAIAGYTGNTILDGLEMDGTLKWRVNLGINIRSGAHYTQFMVYDLNSDGIAEVACKTAPGTKSGTGSYLSNGPAASDDDAADYRNTSGYILTGPEYLTIFNGQTGAELVTTNYVPARGTVSDWGDSYGNRVDRFLACVAYLDGIRPSLVMCRGYYTRTVLAAWDYRNGSLTQRWTFDSNVGYTAYAGQGNHNLAVGDVDGDGKDEIMYGSCAIDDNGAGLYNTALGHGDAGHLADINPNSAGLEYFKCHEGANGSTIPGLSLRTASSGSMLFNQTASGDIGRCLAADIDPNYAGYELWGSDGSGIHTCTGTVITTTYPTTAGGGWTYNFGIWWDGDLLRELLDRGVITKWNYTGVYTDRVATLYNYGASSNNGTKYNPCLQADILGDWREEIIFRYVDNQHLMIFSTPYSTTQRMYTLMHDPVYRLSIAWQNVAYNMPPNVGFYFGSGMSTPSNPNIVLVGDNTTYYKLRNRTTSLYIDGLGLTTDGVNCGQNSSSTSYNQQWQIEVTGTYVKLKNRSTGKYIDGLGATTLGAAAAQWSSSTSYNQQWTMEISGSFVRFKNRATSLYLDGMGRTTVGSALGQWSWSSSYNQQWSLTNLKSASVEENRINFTEDVDIKVYPNPAPKGIIDIELKGITGNTCIKVLDLRGSLVREIQTTGESLLHIDLNINPGVYILQVINGERTTLKKLIVR